MKKFPGEIQKVRCKFVLDDEQIAWLKRVFPANENHRIAKAMGVSATRVHEYAKEYGLKKSEAGAKAIMRRSRIAAAKTNEKNGCYDRKRGKPVSAATIAGRQRRWQEERDGLRENAHVWMRREEPERYKAWMEKRSKERKESIRKEKLRVMYGLERKTHLKAVVLVPYKRSQTHHRCSALKRGYILTEDCSEGNPDRYTIYYDKDTIRSEKFENNCVADGFVFCEWKY